MTLPQYQQILAAGHPWLHFVLVAVGGLAGLAFIVRESRSWKLPVAHRVGLITAVLTGGLLGSALPELYVAGVVRQYATLCFFSSKTIIAGLFFGFVGAILYKKFFRLKAETSDAFALGSCLMIAIGKLGCYAAHCCFGIATTSAIGHDFGDGVSRLPVQWMESCALFAVFGLLYFLYRRRLFPDRRLFIFFALYGLLRYGFEFLREPIAASAGNVGFYQWLALGLALTGIFQIAKRSFDSPLRSVSVPVSEPQ